MMRFACRTNTLVRVFVLGSLLFVAPAVVRNAGGGTVYSDDQGPAPWAGSIQANIRSGRKVVHQRADGSIIIAGHGNLEKLQGVGLVAVTEDGEALWQRVYGNGMHLNKPLGLGSLPDGSIVLFGYLYDPSIRGGQVPWLAKLTAEGAIQWERLYDGDGAYLPTAVDMLPDGGVVAAGRSGRNSVWVMRIDTLGNAWVPPIRSPVSSR